MSNTIKYWLIANFEVFSFLIFLFIIINGSKSTEQTSQATVQYTTFQYVLFGIAVAVDVYLSVMIAIFSFRNFDEVVSRRMLWRNSNVSLFQEQLKYAISRFGSALLLFGLIELVVIVYTIQFFS